MNEPIAPAVILVGHGSLRPGSGAAMIRIAARVREAGIAPVAAAGFLNYSQPRFEKALERCIAHGANSVVVQPYFLVPGKFVRIDLPRMLEKAGAAYPMIRITLAAPFGCHPALAELVLKRVSETPALLPQDGLLIMAHGSPDPTANMPIEGVAEHIRAQGHFQAVTVGYMDLNTPSIPNAIDMLVAQGVQRIVAVPFFLQLGGHVAEDLPATILSARRRHPAISIDLASHLGYDLLLLEVIAERIRGCYNR